MNKVCLVGVGLMLALGPVGAASAQQVVPTTVTAVGPYGNNLSVINDGVFPANGTNARDASTVYFGSDAFTGGDATSFTFSFGGLYSISQIMAAVDNNDDYVFNFFNGATNVGSYTYTADQGSVTSGIQNFTSSITPIQATSAVLTAANGDHFYSVGEAEFAGTAVTAAVPEPASWAMMIVGFGLIGAGLRYRQRRAVLRYV